VLEEELLARFESEGCPPDQAKLYVVAGRQLYQQQEDSFFGGRERGKGREVEKGITFTAREGEGSEDCHVCQPFTKLVRDTEKLKACKALATPLGDLRNPHVMYKFLRSDLERQDQEVFVVVTLDFRGQLRDYAEVARGQRHRVATDIEDITRIVIKSVNEAGADGYVVAHCHPTGVAEPSEADGDLTRSIQKASKVSLPTIHFVDHIVVGIDEFYSFAMNDWKDDGKVVRVRS